MDGAKERKWKEEKNGAPAAGGQQEVASLEKHGSRKKRLILILQSGGETRTRTNV